LLFGKQSYSESKVIQKAKLVRKQSWSESNASAEITETWETGIDIFRHGKAERDNY
jgi:hypothetical protein